VPAAIGLIQQVERVFIDHHYSIEFISARDLLFNRAELLPRHSNAMRFVAMMRREHYHEKYFLFAWRRIHCRHEETQNAVSYTTDPMPFRSAAELLSLCEVRNLSIAELQLINEIAYRPQADLLACLDSIGTAMHACIDRGLRTDGELPGGLKVRRRARALFQSLDTAAPTTWFQPTT